MVSIQQNSDRITQINLIKVEPGNQQQLLKLMRQQVEVVMSQQPGFISSSLHSSVDGTQVVNYVQWTSQELLDAAHQAPEFIA